MKKKKTVMQQSTSQKNIFRSSSDFSYFASTIKSDSIVSSGKTSEPLLHFRTAHDHVWLDEIWHNMRPAQRIEAVIPYTDEKGRGVLIKAVREHDIALIYTLLKNPKVKVNQADLYGNTALHYAALMKDKEALDILLNSPLVICCLINRDERTAYDLLCKEFDDRIRERCYARQLLDKIVSDYAHSYNPRITSIASSHEAVKNAYDYKWCISEYGEKSFPEDGIPFALQNQIIEHHFALHTRL